MQTLGLDPKMRSWEVVWKTLSPNPSRVFLV